MQRSLLSVAFLLMACTCGYTQFLFKGIVIDKDTGKPIQDANIIILGTPFGTITGMDGSFELNSDKKKPKIVISHLSYSTFQTEISSKPEIQTINMEPAIYQLDIVNLALGEYNGPLELIEFDSLDYSRLLEERQARNSDEEFTIVENPAEFYGGTGNLITFLAENFKYPKEVLLNNYEGMAYVLFDVTEKGTLDNIDVKLINSPIPDILTKEFTRLFTSMPLWLPACQRQKPVRVRYVVPIRYAANGYGQRK